MHKRVLAFAIAFAGIGLSALLTKAVIEFLANDDPWFLVILIFAVGLLIAGLWPIRRNILALFDNKS